MQLKLEENSSLDILSQFVNSVKDDKFWSMKCKLCLNSIKYKPAIISNFYRLINEITSYSLLLDLYIYLYMDTYIHTYFICERFEI